MQMKEEIFLYSHLYFREIRTQVPRMGFGIKVQTSFCVKWKELFSIGSDQHWLVLGAWLT